MEQPLGRADFGKVSVDDEVEKKSVYPRNMTSMIIQEWGKSLMIKILCMECCFLRSDERKVRVCLETALLGPARVLLKVELLFAYQRQFFLCFLCDTFAQYLGKTLKPDLNNISPNLRPNGQPVSIVDNSLEEVHLVGVAHDEGHMGGRQ